MNRRGGFTLIEMLGVMAGLTVLLSTSVLILHSLFRADRAARQADDQLARRAVLADAFRADVHASDLTLPAWQGQQTGPTVLILKRNDAAPVIWEWKEQRLLRRQGSLEQAFRAPATEVQFRVEGDRITLISGMKIVAQRRQP